ncbi:amidohydrolase family protein [Kribbella sp. NBC_00889]|uniref:amidohydrolase family protein n=1 Tax=Kribbella sp. NBC_00889 TaxID=2975974 RepID=UPI003864330C|nr:amidohydrolase family protein [Kribbella sp. NBC_00889]
MSQQRDQCPLTVAVVGGGCASLLDCLRWSTGPGGLSLETAVTMATTTHADLLGLRDRGRLEVGSGADLLQLTRTPTGGIGDLAAIVVNGKLIACKGVAHGQY